MNFIKTHRRKLTIGGLVGLFASVGVAVAAVLISAHFTGSTVLGNTAVSLKIQSAEITVEAGGVTCKKGPITDASVEITPKTRTINGGPGTVEGSCDVSVVVKNTGDNAITSAGFRLITPVAGWSFENGNAASPIEPDATGVVTFTIRAGSAATAGPFDLALDYSAL